MIFFHDKAILRKVINIRHAKEGFDSDNLEKKCTIVAKLGEVLTILNRTIQFTTNKYFVPIEKMNESLSQLSEMVRTNSDKIKSPTFQQDSLSWLRRLDSNQ